MRAQRTMRFSPSEERILSLLPQGGERITTEALARLYYGRAIPFNGRIIVAGLVRNLERKTTLMKDPTRVRRTRRAGPHPIQVWLERRGG